MREGGQHHAPAAYLGVKVPVPIVTYAPMKYLASHSYSKPGPSSP